MFEENGEREEISMSLGRERARERERESEREKASRRRSKQCHVLFLFFCPAPSRDFDQIFCTTGSAHMPKLSQSKKKEEKYPLQRATCFRWWRRKKTALSSEKSGNDFPAPVCAVL